MRVRRMTDLVPELAAFSLALVDLGVVGGRLSAGSDGNVVERYSGKHTRQNLNVNKTLHQQNHSTHRCTQQCPIVLRFPSDLFLREREFCLPQPILVLHLGHIYIVWMYVYYICVRVCMYTHARASESRTEMRRAKNCVRSEISWRWRWCSACAFEGA